MHNSRRTARFRELIGDGKLHVRPSAFDALSAKILERAGFEVIGISGYCVSVSMLGKPDVGLVTMSETARVCRDICKAVSIPVMVDADTGYGDAINAMRTVDAIIEAGAGGLFIEDQVEPKRCGHVQGKQLLPLGEAVAKIRGAARVRDELDRNFVLMARTDARGAVGGSFEEAVRRAQAYLDAGADMIFPEGLLTADEIGRFVAAIDAPINYNRTGVSPMLDLDELCGLGVRFVSNAGGTFRAATRAVWDYFHALKAEDPAKASPVEPADGHKLADLDGFLGLRQIEQLNRELYAGMGN
jgi:2-methylisocitrate lyase-like PEP mutase family enzyme